MLLPASNLSPVSAPPTPLHQPTARRALLFTRSQLVVFDAAKGELTEWTLRNSAPIVEISASAEVPLRLSFNPAHPETVVLSAQVRPHHSSPAPLASRSPFLGSFGLAELAVLGEALPRGSSSRRPRR